MKTLLVVLAISLLASACGSLGTGSGPGPSPTPGATPSVTPDLSFDVAISEKDRTVSLHVGQKLEVVLHAGSGMTNWTQPRSSNESILVPIVNPAATAVRGVTLAAYKAVSSGAVQVTSTSSPICPPGQACPMYVAVYSATVTVTP